MMRRLSLATVLIVGACAPSPLTGASATPPSGVATCVPGDQDAYVYRPARLSVLAPCIRLVGTVEASSVETDGDVHLNVRLDEAYRGVLRPGNDFEDGDLIVEPVCQIAPPQADAIRVCASDPAPLDRVPKVGDHVWLEGRYVIDVQHHDWAELHPLYRWGTP
jgi:hypothetical protein